MLKLNPNEIGLLRKCLTNDGRKEVTKNDKGEEVEVDSLRRLNGEESAQRRFFFKACDASLEGFQKELSETQGNFIKVRNEKLAELKAKKGNEKKEEKDLYPELDILLKDEIATANAKIQELTLKKLDIDINDKTKAVVKKYFEDYGNVAGWEAREDAIVTEVMESLV